MAQCIHSISEPVAPLFVKFVFLREDLHVFKFGVAVQHKLVLT